MDLTFLETMWSEVMELFIFPSHPEGEVATCNSGLKWRFFSSYYVVSETKVFPCVLIMSCPFGTKSMNFLAAAPGYQIIFCNL